MSVRATVLACSMCLVLTPAPTWAQGFGLYEQGACAMSRGGAAAADACDDGSAVYTNPAGLAGGKGLVVSLGGTLVLGSGTFRGDSGRSTALDHEITMPPHAYLRWGSTDRLAFGVGFYVPYGLGVKWPLDFEGRFLSYDSHLQTGYVQPTIAYAFGDRVSVGVCPLTAEELAGLYQELPRFRAHCRAIDPSGVFVNEFARDALGF